MIDLYDNLEEYMKLCEISVHVLFFQEAKCEQYKDSFERNLTPDNYLQIYYVNDYKTLFTDILI